MITRNINMNRNRFLTFLAICSSIASAAADTFTVKNTNASGADSFAQAIVEANAHPNIDADTPDIIAFDIPASDPNRNAAWPVRARSSEDRL